MKYYPRLRLEIIYSLTRGSLSEFYKMISRLLEKKSNLVLLLINKFKFSIELNSKSVLTVSLREYLNRWSKNKQKK